MKNKGIIIAIILIAIGVVAYFLLKKKSADKQTVTTSTESTTGISQLFNSGAIGALFGGGKSDKGNTSLVKPMNPNTDIKPTKETITAINITDMLGGFGS